MSKTSFASHQYLNQMKCQASVQACKNLLMHTFFNLYLRNVQRDLLKEFSVNVSKKYVNIKNKLRINYDFKVLAGNASYSITKRSYNRRIVRRVV